ncbi:MAG: alpha/beta hydrolase [Pseudomonadota bacterium]|nr:alpha/beta hydrolase [Pseudomonadota bacterium]
MSRRLAQAEPDAGAVQDRTARDRIAAARRAGALLAGAGLLAALAVRERCRARRAEHAHPPLGRFIMVDGVRLHYLERGHGDPLVYFHGNGGTIREALASGLVDLAAERYRVIVFDRPGYGHSSRPAGRSWMPEAQAAFFRRALEALGVARPILVGHSWGPFIALELALRDPAYVRGLVLLSGFYVPMPRLDMMLISLLALPGLGTVLRHTLWPSIARALWAPSLRPLFAPAPVSPCFAAEFPRDMALRPSQFRASAAETAMMLPAALALRPRYRELRVPVIIMAGRGDRHVPPQRHSAWLHEQIPGSELRLVEGAGHMVHHTFPEQALAAIDRVARRAAA